MYKILKSSFCYIVCNLQSYQKHISQCLYGAKYLQYFTIQNALNKTFLSKASCTLTILLLLIFYGGCDSQKNFKPQHVYGKIEFNDKLDKPLVSSNQASAKLKNNAVITDNGLSHIRINEHENLLYADSKQWLIGDGCAGLLVIPLLYENNIAKLDRNNMKTIVTKGCVVSASIKGDLVAGVLASNTLFLYDLAKDTFKFQIKEESIYAISSRHANPIILDTLVIFPTLDGRLNTIDITQGKSVKNIIVNTEKFLNNIIYLKVQKDELVSATHKRIYTLIHGESYGKELEIRDIYFDGTHIYALSLNGTIYQFDKTLATLQSVKLPYANLNGIIIKKDHLYTFDNSGGYLIDLLLNDFSYEAFKLKFGIDRWFSKRVTMFYTPNIFYINNNILNFNEALKKTIYENKK
ncbi:MAG: plasminogen-binding protein pgbB [Helicobacter trogontum]|uniref:plasminogen-binding protein pgbB n=1 Tax=Helicobacter trogontum TaxID=50960 RepID=UPI00242E6AE7|nr:plasminogen-binding protein pgbB [Helicobacter trogontum]MCI5786571.1 plasminogen-binding protein pgbB [Helicobacter trogontum]